MRLRQRWCISVTMRGAKGRIPTWHQKQDFAFPMIDLRFSRSNTKGRIKKREFKCCHTSSIPEGGRRLMWSIIEAHITLQVTPI